VAAKQLRMEIARVEELLGPGDESEIGDDGVDAEKGEAEGCMAESDSHPSDGVTGGNHSVNGAFEELLLRQQQQHQQSWHLQEGVESLQIDQM
jgi:hypothetical protein